MLRWLIRRKLDSEEKKLGESIDYIRHVVDVSPALFLRFCGVMPFSNSRKILPKDAWFVAQIVALEHEDCGTCLQIGINLAQQAGVDAVLIRAVVAGDIDAVPGDMADVMRFTRGVVTASGDDDAVREILRERYGERGLIELSYAIASARIPPTVKRALGYARSCSLVPAVVR
jgi:hypothetical protein